MSQQEERGTDRIQGVIFDLDGTLVDSGLDFECMRREMELEPGMPLLETLAVLDGPRAERCQAILARHELEGANRAHLMPGAREFLNGLTGRGVRKAVFTRNSGAMARRTLTRLKIQVDALIAREDAPAKPDPAGIWKICEAWGLDCTQVVMVGDYLFDVEAGQRAGVRTVLYTAGRSVSDVPFDASPDFYLECFTKPNALIEWLFESTT